MAGGATQWRPYDGSSVLVGEMWTAGVEESSGRLELVWKWTNPKAGKVVLELRCSTPNLTDGLSFTTKQPPKLNHSGALWNLSGSGYRPAQVLVGRSLLLFLLLLSFCGIWSICLVVRYGAVEKMVAAMRWPVCRGR